MTTALTGLSSFKGKNIGKICPFSIGKDDTRNHCAHFVSHVLGYDFAETCKNFTLTDKQNSSQGATLRVDKLFNSSPDVNLWANRPPHLVSCLIFVTLSRNVSAFGGGFRMHDNPKKHVGIFLNGEVWHYGNTNDTVLCDTEKAFLQKFSRTYRTAGQTVEFYYGSFLQ